MGYRSAIGAGFDPRKVPTQRVVLDTTHPLAQGVIHAQVYGGRPLGADFVGPPLPFIVPGNAAYTAGSIGQAVTVASGDARQTISTPTGLPADDCDFSFRWLFEPSSVSGYNCLLRNASGIGTGDPVSGFYILNGIFNAYQTGVDHTVGPTLSVGALADITVTKAAGSTTGTVYVNGVGYSFTTSTPSFYLASAALAVWGDQYSQYILGKRYQFLAWNRVLTSGEAVQLRAKPFVMFRPVVQRAYFVGASGGASYSASLSDTTATSDAITGTLAAMASLSDTSVTSDAITASVAVHAALTDTAAASDSLSGSVAVQVTLSDTAAASDTLAGALSITATLSDTAASSDSLPGGTVNLTGALADTAATSETWTHQLNANAALSDTVAASDSLLIAGAVAYTASMSDTVATSDSFFSTMHAVASWSDSAATSDVFRIPTAPTPRPTSGVAPAGQIRPPLNDPPMRGPQFSQAWAQFFQGIAARVSTSSDFATSTAALATAPSYASDAAAEAGGVPVGALYRNGNAVHIRLT